MFSVLINCGKVSNTSKCPLSVCCYYYHYHDYYFLTIFMVQREHCRVQSAEIIRAGLSFRVGCDFPVRDCASLSRFGLSFLVYIIKGLGKMITEIPASFSFFVYSSLCKITLQHPQSLCFINETDHWLLLLLLLLLLCKVHL